MTSARGDMAALPRPPPRPGTSATPRSSSARPPSGRQPSSRTPKADNIGDDVLMEMQFAAVAESLRRTCFLYANRFVEVQHGGSGDEFDDDAIGDELADGKQKVFMHQLPNTDAGPYDSARVSPSVLVAIAEDMMITHHLLHPDEVKAAVVETFERRNRRAHLPATMDKTLHDFLIVCANRVMAKKPFCNVYGSATIRQKVRALVDFVCLDYQQVIDDVLHLRFSPINEIRAAQHAVQSEAQRLKQRKRKYRTLDDARAGVSELWAHIHEIYLFFCETPLPRELPDAEKHTAGDVEKDETVASSEAMDDEIELKMVPGNGKVEIKMEIQKVNLDAIIQFHPSIKNSTEFYAARAIQRCFRRGREEKLRNADPTRHALSRIPAASRQSWHPEHPRPPCGPTVASLLPHVPELTSRYTLPPGAMQRRASLQVAQRLGIEQTASHNEEAGQKNEKLPVLSAPKLMITRPVHEIIEWKRLVVEEDSFLSSRSSTSVVGEAQIPIYNDRLGIWTQHKVVWKKPPTPRCPSSRTSRYRARPGTANARISQKGPNPLMQNDRCDASAPRLVGVGDRRTIVQHNQDEQHHLQPRKVSETTRPSSAHFRTGNVPGMKNRSVHGPGDSRITRDGASQGNARPRLSTTNLGGTKIKGMSIFSDDPVERKAALDQMSRRERKAIHTMKMTQEVEELHEHVLEKWRQGKQMHDPFTYSFNQAALKIQRMGRAWLTRKIVREGKFLRDGMKAWLSAQPKTEFSSSVARIQLSEVLKVFKIFGLCPKVVDPSEILRSCLEIMYAEAKLGSTERETLRTDLSWSEFQEVCWRLSFKMREEVSEDDDPPQELDALIQVDELLRTMLEGKKEAFVPSRAPAWIRGRILDYADLQQQHMLLHAQSEGPKGMSPLRLDSTTCQRNFPPRVKQGGSFKRPPRGKDAGSRSERRSELARSVVSDADTRGPKSSKGGSVGVGVSVAADGISAYTGLCVQLDLEPIPTIVHQLHGTHLNLSHYDLDEEQVQCLAAGLEKNTRITSLVMVDSGLSSDSLCILFEALRRNLTIRHADFSENDGFDRAAIAAMSEYIAKTHALKQLVIRGVGMSDVSFDFIVRNGVETNTRSLAHLDLSYNMLTDDSLDNIEQIILVKASLQTLDLPWNLLSEAGVKRIEAAVHERSKPRSSKRSDSSRVHKPMAKITVSIAARMQRLSIMHHTGASGALRWHEEPPALISQADYITLRVAQRSPKITPFVKFRLLRLFTSRRSLSPQMAAEQLVCNFKSTDPALREVAVDMLLRKLASPEQMYELRDLVDREFVGLVDDYIKNVSGSPSGSPANSRSFI